MSRLLILSCSQRKRLDTDLLPAIERYDGPAFRVLRRYLQSGSLDTPEIQILSAEYGLIAQDQPIPYYDRKMTAARADELRSKVLAELKKLLEQGNQASYTEILCCVGKVYLGALSGIDELLPDETKLIHNTGSQGRKLAQLRNWLYGRSLASNNHPSVKPASGRAFIRGIEITCTPDQVFEVARNALLEGRGNPNAYQSWYVLIDGQRVAPKWLVSQLTDLALSRFVTDEARQVLDRLGVEVRRL
jgi:hypothetical protein